MKPWVKSEVISKDKTSGAFEVKLLEKITKEYTQTGTNRETSDGFKL